MTFPYFGEPSTRDFGPHHAESDQIGVGLDELRGSTRLDNPANNSSRTSSTRPLPTRPVIWQRPSRGIRASSSERTCPSSATAPSENPTTTASIEWRGLIL